MSETGGLVRESAPVEPIPAHLSSPVPFGLPRRLRGGLIGITAIAAKDLRGRMRGRRAFVILTVYLALLVVFGWMIELTQESAASRVAGGLLNDQSARIGEAIFIGLLALETLLVLFLAPAFTAGAISTEREKQTLDLLATTPVSSRAIVLGKLFSALTYVFLLIGASVPLSAIVFVFGGVGPEDLLRGYLVLIVEAIGLGSVGLFWSALMRRTQAAIVATYFTVLAMTLGATFVFWFLWSIGTRPAEPAFDVDQNGIVRARPLQAPPEALLWFNPFVADADVICAVDVARGDWCRFLSFATGRAAVEGNAVSDLRSAPVPQPLFPGVAAPDVIAKPGVILKPGVANAPAGLVPDGGVAPERDTFWPHSAIAWIVLSAILTIASVQLVSPTRRWRPRLGRSVGQSRAAGT